MNKYIFELAVFESILILVASLLKLTIVDVIGLFYL